VIQLLLNPSLKLGLGENSAVLVSEVMRVELPLDSLPLLQRLREPTDIDEIAPDEQAPLMYLAKRKLLVNANLRGLAPEVASYWLARHYNLKFIDAQLNLRMQFVGTHAHHYAHLFRTRYPECKVVDAGASLLVCVTDDLFDGAIPDYVDRPQVLIKVGGIKQSIGPVLSPAFGLQDLRKRLQRPFDANLSVSIPAGLQTAADGILLNELYHLRVQAGSHAASHHVVEWNMSRMEKNLWRVKFR
jgi:hypothetical protein